MELLVKKGTRSVAKHTSLQRFYTSQTTRKHRFDKNAGGSQTIPKLRSTKEILETAIIAKKKPHSYTLPKDFFIENRTGATVTRLNDSSWLVHRDLRMEKEGWVDTNIIEQKSQPDDKQYIHNLMR